MHDGRVARLGPAAVTMLESVYQHRLLSTTQLHDLHTPTASPQWTRRNLAMLRAAGLIAVTRAPRGRGLWYVTERGADAVETITSRAELRRKIITPEQAAGPLQAHTLGVNDVGLAFVTAARDRGDECGPFAWRHEIAHPISAGRVEQVIADAVLTYQLEQVGAPTRYLYRFVEFDRATITVADLAGKLARYGRLYRYAPPARAGKPTRSGPLWQRRYPTFPGVLLVLAGDPSRATRERRRARVLSFARASPELRQTLQVRIAVCLHEDLIEQGPFARIFLTLAEPRTASDWLGPTSGRA